MRVRLVACLIGLCARAGSPETSDAPFAIEHWAVEQGLPQNSVESLLPTRDGFLWIGTAEGLARFDGLRFRVFDRLRVPALPGDVVNALLEDRSGAVWIGTGHGLARYRGGVFERMALPAGAASAAVLALAEGGDGEVWIGTRDHGLWRWSEGRFDPWGAAQGLLETTVLALHAAPSGRLWIGMRRGLQSLARGRVKSYAAAEGLPDAPISSVVEAADGVWIGTDGAGLLRLRDGRIRPHRAALKVPLVRALHPDGGGGLWVGTYGGGVVHVGGERARSWTTRDGLGADSVKCLALDRDGGVFVGTGGGGLNRLRRASVRMLTSRSGLTTGAIRAVLPARDGSLWISTHGGGLNHVQGGRVRRYSRRDGLADDVVFGLAEDGAGTLWVGTRRGLSVRRGERFVTAAAPGAPAKESVRSLFVDQDGTLWAGTLDAGLFHLEGGVFTRLGRAQGLSSDWITFVTRTRDDSLWVATFGGGLNRVERGGFITVHGRGEGLLSDRIFAVHEDAEGVLWIATGGGGLSRMHAGRFSAWTRREGAPSNTFYWILEDGPHLWLSSHRGVFRVRKDSLAELAEGRRRGVQALALGRADGLTSLECNGGTQPAGARWADRLLFPTLEGVAIIEPAAVAGPRAPSRVVIEDIRADGEPLPLAEAVFVPPGFQRLEIGFTAPSFTAAHRLRFRYRLAGFEDEWVEAGTSRTAQYTALRPGDYRLELAAGDVDTDRYGEPLHVTLKVLPRLYETAAFRWLAGAALLASAAAGYHTRVRRLKERQRVLAAMVEERTRSLKEAGERLAERNRELQETIRVKDEVVSIVAHDIRSPLTAVQGFGELLSGRVTDAESKRMLEDMRTCSQQIVRLTEDMLTLSRLDAGALAPERRAFDLRALALEHAFAARSLGSPQVGFEGDRSPVVVEADPARIAEVLDNLISNAVKYSPDGGKVRVRVDVAEAEAHVSVSDEGIGIPEKDLPRLFQKFSRLEQGRRRGIRGTGLGLYICRSFVEAHGGRIWVESRPGAGSVFRFALPLQGGGAAAGEKV